MSHTTFYDHKIIVTGSATRLARCMTASPRATFKQTPAGRSMGTWRVNLVDNSGERSVLVSRSAISWDSHRRLGASIERATDTRKEAVAKFGALSSAVCRVVPFLFSQYIVPMLWRVRNSRGRLMGPMSPSWSARLSQPSGRRARPSRSRSRLARWRLISSAQSDTPSCVVCVGQPY